MTMAQHNITWFPALLRGLASPAQQTLQSTIQTAWLLLIDGNALIEDFEGAAGEKDLVDVLKLRFVELLVEIDFALDGHDGAEEYHFLPTALDSGLHALGHVDGAAIQELLKLGVTETDPHARLQVIWEAIVAAFPGDLPNPLLADGQGDVLRALQNWSRLCRAAEVDDSFLGPLVQAV